MTVTMFENAKTNGGMVDQTIFKTAIKYGFNSLYFDEISLGIVDDYVQYVRPLLHPQCDYLLLNRNGMQFQKTYRSTKRARIPSNRQVYSPNKI